MRDDELSWPLSALGEEATFSVVPVRVAEDETEEDEPLGITEHLTLAEARAKAFKTTQGRGPRLRAEVSYEAFDEDPHEYVEHWVNGSWVGSHGHFNFRTKG